MNRERQQTVTITQAEYEALQYIRRRAHVLTMEILNAYPYDQIRESARQTRKAWEALQLLYEEGPPQRMAQQNPSMKVAAKP